jgi:hypothetical protein
VVLVRHDRRHIRRYLVNNEYNRHFRTSFVARGTGNLPWKLVDNFLRIA